MARRKPFEASMDYIYFLTQVGHVLHSELHGSDTGFLTCDRELCVQLREQIRKIVEEAV